VAFESYVKAFAPEQYDATDRANGKHKQLAAVGIKRLVRIAADHDPRPTKSEVRNG
jgi:hypothetical protein